MKPSKTCSLCKVAPVRRHVQTSVDGSTQLRMATNSVHLSIARILNDAPLRGSTHNVAHAELLMCSDCAVVVFDAILGALPTSVLRDFHDVARPTSPPA